MNTLLKNLGIIMILLGVILLFISEATELVDYNWFTGGALGLQIAGLITHIIMNKRIQD